jgi:hypothetical protein
MFHKIYFHPALLRNINNKVYKFRKRMSLYIPKRQRVRAAQHLKAYSVLDLSHLILGVKFLLTADLSFKSITGGLL